MESAAGMPPSPLPSSWRKGTLQVQAAGEARVFVAVAHAEFAVAPAEFAAAPADTVVSLAALHPRWPALWLSEGTPLQAPLSSTFTV